MIQQNRQDKYSFDTDSLASVYLGSHSNSTHNVVVLRNATVSSSHLRLA